jgi:hypothetical protein
MVVIAPFLTEVAVTGVPLKVIAIDALLTVAPAPSRNLTWTVGVVLPVVPGLGTRLSMVTKLSKLEPTV